MIPAAFDYDVAESVEHAVGLLGGDTDAKALAKGVTYAAVHYRTDFMAGSLIKPYFDKPGKVFGIPDAGVERFKNLFGFEESAYYAQRALFPQVVDGIGGSGSLWQQATGTQVPEDTTLLVLLFLSTALLEFTHSPIVVIVVHHPLQPSIKPISTPIPSAQTQDRALLSSVARRVSS